MDSEHTQQRIEAIILRMQEIQKAIRATGKPSMLELGELRDLGNEYARLVAALGRFPQTTG